MTARVALTGPSTAFAAALAQTGITFDRYDELAAADLTQYDAVLVVAASYPQPSDLDTTELAEFVAEGGRAYVEFAKDLTGFLPASEELRIAHTERIFNPGTLRGLEPMSILDEHSSRAQVVRTPDNATELLTYGNVAGTHLAVFGRPDKTFPALLSIPRAPASCSTQQPH